MNDDAGGVSAHERPVMPLLARLQAMEDLRRLEGDEDEAELCREVAEELHNLAWALSLPGFDRMATDEQEAAHQAGLATVNAMLTRMENARAEHEAMVRDAERYRFIRDADKSDDLMPYLSLYAMGSLDDYVDAALAEYARRHNDEVQPRLHGA